MNQAAPLLEVRDLSLEFRTRSGTVRALEHVSLAVRKGETVALVGESGSGKSVLAYALLGISDRAAKITSGSIRFGGMEITRASEDDLAEVRGREASMIFQSPRTALNPIRRVGAQVADVLRRHAAVPGVEMRARAVEALRQVKIADPERRHDAYPFELSGGMCQRVMIALALACKPSLLIADEPTTGLDVTTQATIMDLIKSLAAERRMATVLITHDLALAAEYCDRIVVMHAGHVVECAPTAEILRCARHPYTRQLIRVTPAAHESLAELTAIPGSLPDLRRADLPPCRFRERCERANGRCDDPLPHLTPEATNAAACWHPFESGMKAASGVHA